MSSMLVGLRRVGLCGAGLLWASTVVAALPHLSVTHLGPLTGQPYSVLGDINDSGQAIGFGLDDAGHFTPVMYSAAAGMVDFGTLVGAPAGAAITLHDINNRGQVVGEWNSRPFVWSRDAGVQYLAATGVAEQINEAGQVTFLSNGSGSLYTPGSGTEALPVNFRALSLNNQGLLAGDLRIETDGGPIFRAATYGPDGLTVLGTLPAGVASHVRSIDDAGTVVGYSEVLTPDGSYRLHAFRQLAGGVMEDLHTGSGWGSSADRVDSQGRVLGQYWDEPLGEGPSSAEHAYWWEPGGQMVDVNSLLSPADAALWHIQSLGPLNAQGQAVAYALIDGYPQAALVSLSAPVPEPAGWLLGLVAGPLVGWGVRRRRAPPGAGLSRSTRRAMAAMAVVAGGAGAALPAAAALPTFEITDLSALTGGTHASAVGINDAGDVVGYRVDAGGDGHPFYYSAYLGLLDFRALVGAPSTTYLTVAGINTGGQVVGQWGSQAYLYTPKVGVQFVSEHSSEAVAVNDAGQVVVHVQPDTTQRFSVETGSETVPLRGFAINGRGDIAGHVQAGSHQQAAVHDAAGLRLLDALPGTADSRATDIADDGTVVGAADFIGLDGERHARAFLQTATGDAIDLLGPAFNGIAVNSTATAIDRAGRVSGAYWTEEGDSRAFVWQAGLGAVDVESLLAPGTASGWRIYSVGEFNQNGQAVAQAAFHGEGRAVVIRMLATPVPEPGMWSLMLAGLPLLLQRFRKA